MTTPDFKTLLANIREVQADELQIMENNAQANLLIRRDAVARERRFTNEPITGFSHFHDDEPEPTADERAADDYQDFRRWHGAMLLANWLDVLTR